MHNMAFLSVFILVVFSTFFTSEATGGAGLYSLAVKDILGNNVSLERYRGKILLIVNVASECGYTTINYEGLTLLQEDFETKDFIILGFPCNQFGEQEPGLDADIEKFTRDKFGINFPLFSKVSMHSGENASGLYQYLYETTGSKPLWNFCKYLVDRNGEVVQFFTEKDSFSVIRHSVEYLVNKHSDL